MFKHILAKISTRCSKSLMKILVELHDKWLSSCRNTMKFFYVSEGLGLYWLLCLRIIFLFERSLLLHSIFDYTYWKPNFNSKFSLQYQNIRRSTVTIVARVKNAAFYYEQNVWHTVQGQIKTNSPTRVDTSHQLHMPNCVVIWYWSVMFAH